MQAFYIYLTDWHAEMRPVRNRVSFLDLYGLLIVVLLFVSLNICNRIHKECEERDF